MTVNTDRFRTYVTQTGFGLEALAKQQSKHVDFAVLVVGDGELPDSENPANQTDLINQVRHYPVTIEQDPTNSGIWIARAEIPADDGDFFIREAGVKVVNENGALYSYARQPGDYKPVLEEGNAKSYTIRLKFIPGNASVVEAKIDPSVQFATPTDLSNAIKEHKEDQNPHQQYERVDNAADNNEIDSGSSQPKHVKLPQFWRGIAKQLTARFSELNLKTNVMSFVSKAGLYTGWNNGEPVDSGGLTSVVGNQLQIMSAAGHATQLLFGDGYAKFRPQWGSGRWVDFFTTYNRPRMSDISGMTMVAMVNFDGATPNVPARGSFNVNRIIDNGIGDYTIEFENPVSIDKRVIICGQFAILDQADAYTFGEHVKADTTPTLISETQIRVLSRRERNVDVSRAYVIVFGELA